MPPAERYAESPSMPAEGFPLSLMPPAEGYAESPSLPAEGFPLSLMPPAEGYAVPLSLPAEGFPLQLMPAEGFAESPSLKPAEVFPLFNAAEGISRSPPCKLLRELYCSMVNRLCSVLPHPRCVVGGSPYLLILNHFVIHPPKSHCRE